MKYFFYLLFVPVFSGKVYSQTFINPETIPLTPHSPRIAWLHTNNSILITELFSKGLKVVLADTSFKVIQFDVVFDCHSRSLTDFSVKRYSGDHIPASDDYLRRRVITGDVMDVINTVIEKRGVRFRMKEFTFQVIK